MRVGQDSDGCVGVGVMIQAPVERGQISTPKGLLPIAQGWAAIGLAALLIRSTTIPGQWRRYPGNPPR